MSAISESPAGFKVIFVTLLTSPGRKSIVFFEKPKSSRRAFLSYQNEDLYVYTDLYFSHANNIGDDRAYA